jgi:hypothetical protein
MRRSLFLLALVLVACGESDREAFLRDANAACQERAAGQQALEGVPEEELLPAATKLYEQELETLRALEPPEENRARYVAWMRASEHVVDAYRTYAAEPTLGQRERVLQRFDRAAKLAGELGLSECDR